MRDSTLPLLLSKQVTGRLKSYFSRNSFLSILADGPLQAPGGRPPPSCPPKRQLGSGCSCVG